MLDGEGQRRRVTIASETYYFVATINEDGEAAFSCTIPDENKDTNIHRRETANRTCDVLAEMTTALLKARANR